LSTVEGKTTEVADAVRALGGRVEASDPKVGYLRVVVPSDAVSAARSLPSVVAAAVAGLVTRVEPPS